jgi:hypothetical protein
MRQIRFQSYLRDSKNAERRKGSNPLTPGGNSKSVLRYLVLLLVVTLSLGALSRFLTSQASNSSRYRGEQTVVEALRSNQAQPRAMASIVLAGDAIPDLIAGYSWNGMGIVTVQHGNPDAFAPKHNSVFARMQQGYNPDSLLPGADTYQVPETVDFLQVGDFDHDNRKDVLVAARGGDLFLLAGDGRGGLNAPQQISLPGSVTAMTAGEFRALDGWTDIAVGVEGPSGPALLIFDGANALQGEPMSFRLSAAATAVEIAGLDDDSFQDLAVAAGSEVDIIHGWGRKQQVDPQTRFQRISLNSNALDLAVGFFLWNRAGSNQIAVLSDDGAVNILDQAGSDTRPFSDEEIALFRNARRHAQGVANVDVESLKGWQPAQAAAWTSVREYGTSSSVAVDALSHSVLLKAHISFQETDDLITLDGSQHKLSIVRQADSKAGIQGQSLSAAGDLTSVTLGVADAPAAVLALPQKLNGERSLVVMQAQSSSPTIVPLAPTAVITVDRTDDPSGGSLAAVSACTAAGSDCSLRGAVQFANANPGTTISIPANATPYTLATNGTSTGGCDGNTVGDLGVNTATTISGAGSATTIIRQHGTGPAGGGDRVMCMNELFTLNLNYSFSGITVIGGRENGNGVGGGGIIGGEKGNTLTLTDVTISNNQATVANIGGGGIQITGGDLTVTNCLIGGANAPGLVTDRDTVANANANTTSAGGGLYFTPSAPKHTGGTGNLVVTGTTFNHNTASGTGGGGAELEILAFALPGGIGSGTAKFDSSTFTNNQATNGGGLQTTTLATTIGSIAGTVSFTLNAATGSPGYGGGIFVGAAPLLLDGSSATINIAGSNTATTGGSSIGTNGDVTVAGTQTTIGGDASVFTTGSWTNNTGSAISPTNFSVLGGVLTCNNSTMNVSGNFVLSHETTKGGILNANSATINIQGNLNVDLNNGGSGAVGQFNGGTSTFNFNGSSAQSITNSPSITFNSLTDSNTTQPLTANNSFAVGGTLNVNGSNAIFAPVAGAVISGAGTLTGTGTARVTGTGADAFFSQYSITTKTLTNLTVEYIGAAAQTSSVTTYGGLKINNGSGVTLGAGTTTVNGTLTLNSGALAVGTSTLIINNGTSVNSGTLTSGATGTVNYNQGSNGQNVLAASYGNLTFSNATKVLPAAVVGVAGLFTSPVTSGHTITGNTIDFNGAGAQTVPAFNFNNLTISNTHGANPVTLISGGTIGVAGTYTPGTNSFGVMNNTMDFNGSAGQSVAAFIYNNLTISGNRGGGAITLASGNIGVAGSFSPTATNNTYATTGNTVIFTGGSLQSVPAFTFNGLTLQNAAGANLAGNVVVNANMILNSGTLGVGTNTLTLNGFVTAPGGSLSSSTTGTVNYNQGSNNQATVLAANYGNLTFSNFSKALAGSGTIGIAGMFTPGSGVGHSIAGSTIDFNGANPQTIPSFTYNNLTSSGGGISRTLDPVNTINIAGAFTPGTDNYTINGSTVDFNGTGAQTIPSPTTASFNFNNLTVSGARTSNSVTLASGTIGVAGAFNGNATFTSGNYSSAGNTMNFNGSGAQTIGGTGAAPILNNLTVVTAGGIGMNIDTTVNGTLALTNSDITVAATRTLTQPSSTASTGAFDVVGAVKRTGGPLATGVALTFGNPDNRITLGSGGTTSTDITVALVKAAPGNPNGYAAAVLRTYTISQTGGSGITNTVRLHYLDGDLNSNVENQLNLRRLRTSDNHWVAALPTTRDGSANWVESNAVLIADLPTRWTMSSFTPTAAGSVVTGRIVDNQGTPVEGAVVRLDGTQSRKFITDANGIYRFENVETGGFYTVTPSRANYAFNPSARSFSQIGQTTEAAFGATAASSGLVNPLDTPEYFVRQNYLDFLGREPDEAGFNYWSDQILGCGNNSECIDRKRENVSAAYFLSIEFQQTGGLVDGLYRASYGTRPDFARFMPDTRSIAQGIIVGKANWQEDLETNKAAFMDAFVNRAPFHAAYDGMDNTLFVDTLISHTSVSFTSGERDALVSGLANGTLTRATALRSIAENNHFVNAKFTESFVMMEYFGYLRRDADAGGFAYWLDKLNRFGGNFMRADMVKAFIVSTEYRDRFPR